MTFISAVSVLVWARPTEYHFKLLMTRTVWAQNGISVILLFRRSYGSVFVTKSGWCGVHTSTEPPRSTENSIWKGVKGRPQLFSFLAPKTWKTPFCADRKAATWNPSKTCTLKADIYFPNMVFLRRLGESCWCRGTTLHEEALAKGTWPQMNVFFISFEPKHCRLVHK